MAIIEQELAEYSPELLAKPRWVVLTKIDKLYEEEMPEQIAALTARIHERHADRLDMRVFAISAVAKKGTEALCCAINEALLLADKLESEAAAETETVSGLNAENTEQD
jgi:GTP-binding protein